MGAVSYSALNVIKGNAKEAYRDACEKANDYNGHQEGYSGDIQTSHGFKMRKDNPRYGTKAFKKWEDKIDDNLNKGECVCVEITGAVATRIKHESGYKGKRGLRVFYFFGVGNH